MYYYVSLPNCMLMTSSFEHAVNFLYRHSVWLAPDQLSQSKIQRRSDLSAPADIVMFPKCATLAFEPQTRGLSNVEARIFSECTWKISA